MIVVLLSTLLACDVQELLNPPASENDASTETTAQTPQEETQTGKASSQKAPANNSSATLNSTDKMIRGECSSVTDGGPVTGPGCISGTLSCGETLRGHTKGGGKHFDTKFYEKKFCWPATQDHDGGDERVYQLNIPEGDKIKATVTLSTPCTDLDIAAIEWDRTQCPTISNHINRCETTTKSGKKSETLKLMSGPEGSTWLLVVEGKDDEEGAFSISVECGDWF
jgi:hypothetical protein